MGRLRGKVGGKGKGVGEREKRRGGELGKQRQRGNKEDFNREGRWGRGKRGGRETGLKGKRGVAEEGKKIRKQKKGRDKGGKEGRGLHDP